MKILNLKFFSTIIKTQLQILKKQKINHDCYIYSFGWKGQRIPLRLGQHLRIIQKVKINDENQGQQVQRKYTPISPCSDQVLLSKLQNLIKILFKIYRTSTAQFPNNRKLTPYLESLKQGDIVNVNGPFGKFQYLGNRKFILVNKPYTKSKIFFIAGGTGIAPVYQTIFEMLKMKDQQIQMVLLYANKTQEDIVLKKQLEKFLPRIKIHYMLDNPPNENWKGLTGHVSQQKLSSICPFNQQQTLYIYCGPKAMNLSIVQIFKKYPNSTLFKY